MYTCGSQSYPRSHVGLWSRETVVDQHLTGTSRTRPDPLGPSVHGSRSGPGGLGVEVVTGPTKSKEETLPPREREGLVVEVGGGLTRVIRQS